MDRRSHCPRIGIARVLLAAAVIATVNLSGAARRAFAQTNLPVAVPNAQRCEDVLPGNGARTGYFLSRRNVLPASVLVMVDGARLSPVTGYTLDPVRGALTLAQPVPVGRAIQVRYRYLPPAATLAGLSRLLGRETGEKTTAAGTLIDQILAVGGARSRFTVSYQGVAAVFHEGGAPRKKDSGIRRLGLTGNLGVGRTGSLQFTHESLGADGGGITRQGLTLASGGFSLRAGFLRVDRNFSRFADLADKDRDAMEKLRGGRQFDLAGQWAMGRALKLEAGLLDLNGPTAGRKNSRLLLSLAPGGNWSLGVLNETTGKTENGKKTRDSITRFTGAAVLGGKSRGFALNGLYETTDHREIGGGVASKATTSQFGLRTAGRGALRLSLDGKAVRTRSTGSPDRQNRTLLSEVGLQVGRGGLISYAFASDAVAQGENHTDNQKAIWSLALGRGYLYRRSLDRTWSQDAKNRRGVRQRIEFTQFATDPAEPIFANGERRRSFFGNDDPEIYEKWQGGLTIGGLSLRMDGLSARPSGTGTAGQKNHNLLGKLALLAGWSATYTAYDRNDKDPATQQIRDETGKELTLSGAFGAVRLRLKSLSYDNRRDTNTLRNCRELSLTNARPLSLGPLRQSAFTLGYTSETLRGACGEEDTSPRDGRTLRVVLDGLLGPHRLAAEYADGRLTGDSAPVQNKGFRFTSDERGRFRLGLRRRTRQAAGAQGIESLRTRLCTLDYRLPGNGKLTYARGVNPETPDGGVEKCRSETLGCVADLGRGGKLAASFRTSEQANGKGALRGTAFSLISPAGDVCSYEFSYLNEKTGDGDRRGRSESYVLSFQFLPEGGAASVQLAARWTTRSGDVATVPSSADEARANVEVKMNW